MVKLAKLIIFVFLPIIFFRESLFAYFSQDDFFHLAQVFDKSIGEIFSFFNPINRLEYTFYRPLSRELYNWLMLNIFGLNSLPFHIVNLSLIFLNLILVYKLILKLTNKKLISIFACLFYIFSAVHNIELYYLSSVQLLLASTFNLLCISSFKDYLNSNQKGKLYLAAFLFALALISHESSIVLVLILVLLYFSLNYRISKIKNLLPILAPFIVIILLRFAIFAAINGLPQESEYQLTTNPKNIINTLGWFILWSFGAPEILVDFVGSGLNINPNFIKWYEQYVRLTFPALIFLIGGFIWMSFYYLRHSKNKFLIIFTLFFLTSLLPFLFFPKHKFIYYLSFPIIWFSIMLGLLLAEFWQKRLFKIFVVLYLGVYLITSYQTINLNKITYWAAKRAIAAKYILTDLKIHYPQVSPGTIFFIQDNPDYPVIAQEWGTSSKQTFYILSGSDAFKLFYNDPTIKVYYQAFDQLPKLANPSKIIFYTAKFPY